MADDKKKTVVFSVGGEISEKAAKESGLEKIESGAYGTSYFVNSSAGGSAKKKAPRLAFSEKPNDSNNYAGIYKIKSALIPDYVLKQIRVQNHLIASILRARGNTMAMFGHIKKDRFDIGVEIKIKPEFEEVIKTDQMIKIKDRISKTEKLLVNCGHTEGLSHDERMSLSDFFYLQAQNGLTFGRFATEVVYNQESHEQDKAKRFNRFRPADAGTMAPAFKKADSGQIGAAVRKEAIETLKQVSKSLNLKLDFGKLEQQEYSWIQVIDGQPKQAFTAEEMIIYNLYPSTDVEHRGYPVSPIDTCISSITTHLSIDAYNKLYFQNGRAAKGMLVLNSADIDQTTVDAIKKDFYASINSVNNSFRVPIFGMGPDDSVQWVNMMSNAGEGEFQFLYDQVARNILSTFNMSPDELPGYGHLSRGTNSQTLSESGNEFKLTAARDTGLRPLILKFQAFLNEHLLPLIDPELAQICHIQLSGLDAQSREQESLRLQQDMPIHMNMDEVLTDVDKQPLGHRLAGQIPFNERWQILVDKYLDVGQIGEVFLRDPTAYLDRTLKFKRDPFWMQHMTGVLMQVSPETVKAFYAQKSWNYNMELLKLMIEDELEQDEE